MLPFADPETVVTPSQAAVLGSRSVPALPADGSAAMKYESRADADTGSALCHAVYSGTADDEESADDTDWCDR